MCTFLWHDWSVQIMITAIKIFTRFQLWAQKSLTTWLPGLPFQYKDYVTMCRNSHYKDDTDFQTSKTAWVNSLAPGRFQFNFRYVIFKLTFVNGGWGISYEIALSCTPLDLTDDKSILVQVMAWCRQATSHYLSQCWPRSMSPYGVTRPQWYHFRHNSIIAYCLIRW